MLIVTHNKKTMELASQMYGVTMQEPGVSSIISAALDSGAATDPHDPGTSDVREMTVVG
jgi:hypothetical protein